MTTAAATDHELDEATIRQLTWKCGVCRDLGIKIVCGILAWKIVWPDEVDFGHVREGDENCIGLTWRLLGNNGIVKKTGEHRRSVREGQKGRIVWQYRLESEKLALTYLNRNAPSQPTLFPI